MTERFSDNRFWDSIVAGKPLTLDIFERQMERVRLHLKTHKQGNDLYYVNGQFWIKCYTHKRLEPATWLVSEINNRQKGI